ncbi:peroxisome proliferator-activated receptor gamma coactivator 1-alpha isoform X5 [Herpailurus yagouaroundi]|uniref:peroxisome proliferator-activated receptor gamma coactivator 1-alpha isoform X5 n=1 Tax=Herpailurus yagouaroundi TaxID=1608482 RepID=UPI001AD7BB91|nr:peroxisome proliferator-activated receptor gamma coactivator 1-alpha isoform X5 [Puma yagouaroundi]
MEDFFSSLEFLDSFSSQRPDRLEQWPFYVLLKECAALVGEDQPLCPDLPELDLSELDVNDLDTDSFLGGLKWCSDQSEIISNQYNNEPSNIFEKIDEENEANLLAVLTETLDSLPVDEDGLPSFDALTDGDVTAENEASPSSMPDGTPPPQEAEETSLLKKLLLAPANTQLSYNECSGLSTQNHANHNHRIRTNPAVVKTENSWSNKARSICQQQKPQRRPCSELLKYLTTNDDPPHIKPTENRNSSRDKCTSKKKSHTQSQSQHLQAKPTTLSLPLTPESPNDPKGSPFENKTIERTLSVELSGTAGLTPPTTPPHKANQDNPFRTSPKLKSSCKTVGPPPSKKPRSCYYYESSHCRHRAHRNSPLCARSRSGSPYSRRPRYDSYEEYQHERLKREEYRKEYEKRESERAKQRERQRQKAIEERRVIYVGKIRPDTTRTELRDRFEVFGEIEECTVNLRDDGDSYGFITYRYTCDAFAALENGYTLRRSNETDFELYFCGRKQFFKSNYADLDSNSDDFDPASTKSKYDSLDFDSLLKEAQRSLRR